VFDDTRRLDKLKALVCKAFGPIDPVGEGVDNWQIGDAVVGSTSYGAFAQYCVADARHLMRLPAGMDFDSGASFMLTYGTSLHALRHRAYLESGETLLVMGAAGGVGLAAIGIAKAMGARVIAAASTRDKLASCRDSGADETIDYAQSLPSAFLWEVRPMLWPGWRPER